MKAAANNKKAAVPQTAAACTAMYHNKSTKSF